MPQDRVTFDKKGNADIYLTMDPGKKRDPRLDDYEDGFIKLDDDDNDDFHPIISESENIKEDKGILSKAWDWATSPLESVMEPVKKFGTDITTPSLEANPTLQKLKGFIAGASEGAANLATPINIASFLLPEVAGVTSNIAPKLSSIATKTAKATNLPSIIEGGKHMLSGDSSIGERLQGVAETLLGYAGMKDARPVMFKNEDINLAPIFDESVNYKTPAFDTFANKPDLSLMYTEGNRKLLPAHEGPTYIADKSGRIADVRDPQVSELISEANYKPDFETAQANKLRAPETPVPIEMRPETVNIFRKDAKIEPESSFQLPRESGDTIGGFSKQTNPEKSLGYPLDIVPNRLRPRAIQKETLEKTPSALKRLFTEESGELDLGRIRKLFGKKVGSENPTDIRRALQVRIGQLDAKKALDGEYKLLLPKELQTKLNDGETWRDRLIYGMNKVASSRQVPGTVPPNENAIDTLMQAIRESIPVREAQEASYKSERGQRLKRVEDVKKTGMAGYREKLSQMAGKYKKMEYEPVKLNQKDTDKIMNLIWNNNELSTGEKLSAASGFSKIIGATKEKMLPQRNELEKLGRVLGKENIDEIVELYASLGGLPSKLVHEMISIPKTIGASMDLSAPFRQGIGLVHTKEFWKNLVQMPRMFKSEEFYNGIIKSIHEHPNFKMAEDAGLDLGKLTQSPREEQVFSTLIGNWPGIKHSDRAFSGFLDKLRFDVFNRMVRDGNLQNEPWMREKIATYLNDSTGKGSLGRWEKDADLLNLAFYSPRLIASRARMAGKIFDPALPNAVRKEYIKSLASITSFGVLLGQIAKAGGAEVSSDPTSPDFGKIKIGNTRIDPFGGFQQYAVLLSRLREGYKTSSVNPNKKTQLNTGKFGGATTLSTIQDFGRTKASPVAGYIYDAMKGSTPTGQKFLYSPEAIDRMLPMIANDLWELYQEDPELVPGLAGALGAMTGFGVNTYDKKSLGHSAAEKFGLGNESVNPFGNINPFGGGDIQR